MGIIWNYVWYFFLKSVIDTKIELTGVQKAMKSVKPKKILHGHVIFKCWKPKLRFTPEENQIKQSV